MFKILAFSTLAALTTCGTINTQPVPMETTEWPDVNLYTTFKADAALYTWNGKKLAPFKDIVATLKVDSGRNKIKADAKVGIPFIGKVNAEVLVDLTEGVAYEYIPFLGVC